jgi:hypothetical protein
MANFATNPWSLTSTDPATAPITAATGLTLNADGTVTITTTAGLTFNVNGVPPANWFTVINATNALYNGEYLRLIGASGASTFTMQPLFSIPAGTAQSGGGTLAQCLWPWQVRLEDISWQNAPASGVLDIRDRSGNPEWLATNNTATIGTQNRGKLYWVNGITPILLPAASILILTID